MDLSDISVLKQYIDDSVEIVNKLKAGNLPDEEATLCVYELYANMLDLMDEIKAICREIRDETGIKEAQVKKWAKENEASDDEKKE